MDLVYRVENSSLVSHELELCSKVDGHVHSRRPRLCVPTCMTRLLGVMESYTSPKKACKVMKKKGMDLYSLSNHDCVLDAIELRRLHPEHSFINCEYTVSVDPDVDGQVIHVGCWGIDYAGDSSTPLSDKQVLELHDELMYQRHLGYERFIRFCRKAGIVHVFNHPPWQGTPKRPLSGAQFDELTDAFDVLEVNGDMQLENLFTLEVALQKGKLVCAGTDAHTSRRIGNQYTASLYPVTSPYGFIEAFRKGDIGIGSRFSVPNDLKEQSLHDMVRHQFNGSVAELQKDTVEGAVDYSLHDWSARKLAVTGAVSAASFGVTGAVSAAAGVEYGLIPFILITGVQLLSLLSVPLVIPRREKNASARRTKELYRDYHEHLLRKETSSPRAAIDFHVEQIRKHEAAISELDKEIKAAQERHSKVLPDMVNDPRRWEWLVYRTLRRIEALGSDYDMSLRLGKCRRHDDVDDAPAESQALNKLASSEGSE